MKYDIIWIKGSISADLFIKLAQLRIKKISLQTWLHQLERLASSKCKIIICPHWKNNTHKTNINDIRYNIFTDTMLNNGYLILPKIKNHNHNCGYAITYFKNMGNL